MSPSMAKFTFFVCGVIRMDDKAESCGTGVAISLFDAQHREFVELVLCLFAGIFCLSRCFLRSYFGRRSPGSGNIIC
jgi:hypothetical protein